MALCKVSQFSKLKIEICIQTLAALHSKSEVRPLSSPRLGALSAIVPVAAYEKPIQKMSVDVLWTF